MLMHTRFYKTSISLVSLSFFLCTSYFALAQDAESAEKQEEKAVEVIIREVSDKEKKAAEGVLKKQASYDSTGLDSIISQQETAINQNMSTAQEVAQNAKSNVAIVSQSQRERIMQSPDFERFQEEYADTIGISATPEQLAKMAQKQEDKKYGDDIDAFIAISTSMPESSIQTLLAELSNEHKDKTVVLAFQGAVKGEFARMSYMINALIPQDTEGQFDIVIDPTIFDNLGINQVPMFVMKTDKGWRKVLGDVSFNEALYHSKIDVSVFAAVGPVYDIKEPNLMTQIKEKMKTFDSKPLVDSATDNVLQGQAPKVVLDLAFDDSQYLIDPTVTITQDLVFEGVMFAPKGTTINPLDVMPLTGAYVFVDLSLPEHITQVRKWKLKHPNLRVMTTTILDASEQGKLINEFGFISQINSLIVTRFGLSEIPSIAYQVNNKIKVEVVAVEPEAPITLLLSRGE